MQICRSLAGLRDVEAPDRRTWQEKLADFFTNPVTWIVIGIVVAVIIAVIVTVVLIKKYKNKEFTLSLYDRGEVSYLAVKRGERVPLPMLQREGYRFGGWFIDTAMMTPFVPTHKVECDMTVYAKWSKEAD